MTSPKANRSLNLPPKLWDELDSIAKEEDLAPAEIYRECMRLGLIAKKEQMARALSYETKAEVLKKLRQRQGEMAGIINQLADQLDGNEVKLLEELREYLKD